MLGEITKVVRDAELLKLRQLNQSTDEKRKEIAALKAGVIRRRERLSRVGGCDDALVSGVDGRWEAWCQTGVIRLNMELATLLSQKEEQEQKAVRAFGRDIAVQRLAKK
jgi:uridine phosphorylase